MKKTYLLCIMLLSYTQIQCNIEQSLITLDVLLPKIAKNIAQDSDKSITFNQWKKEIEKLSFNRDRKKDKSYFPLTLEQFEKTIQKTIQNLKNIYTANQVKLKEEKKKDYSSKEYLSLKDSPGIAQKLLVKPNSKIAIHADFHGDVKSLIAMIDSLQKDYMNGWKITDNNFYIILLGDYVDRGKHDVEVLYTAMRLKNENPKNVILMRGNHEDANINCFYGFLQSILSLEDLGQNSSKNTLIMLDKQLYPLLPEALFLGCKNTQENITNYMLLCHGGLEPFYNPSTFLNSNKTYELIELKEENADKNDITIPFQTYLSNKGMKHFLWNDFQTKTKNLTEYTPGRGLKLSNKTTKHYLENNYSTDKNKTRGIIRGHQHSRSLLSLMMHSILQQKPLGLSKLWEKHTKENNNRLWQNIVITLNVAPDTPYGEACRFKEDTYIILEPQEKFKNWSFEIKQNDIVPNTF